MDYKKHNSFLKYQEQGQSTVEYIMLLAVVMTLFFTIYNSGPFQAFLGEDSDFFNNISERLRLDYRYARRINADDDIGGSPVPNHPSFVDGSGNSRFFGYKDGDSYPPN